MREEEIKISDQDTKELQLRVMALRESLSEHVQRSEDRIADLRIEITLLREDNAQLQSIIQEAQSKTPEEAVEPEPAVRVVDEVGIQSIIEGEVVQEED